MNKAKHWLVISILVALMLGGAAINPANTILGIPNATIIKALNGAATDTINIISVDGSDFVLLGASSGDAGMVIQSATFVRIGISSC